MDYLTNKSWKVGTPIVGTYYTFQTSIHVETIEYNYKTKEHKELWTKRLETSFSI